MKLTKSIVRKWKADAQASLAEGTTIPEFYEGRISVYDYLLSGWLDIEEGEAE